MHADHPLRAVGRFRDRGDRKRRCIRREDRIGWRGGIERPEDRPLQGEILQGRLDDDLCLRPDRVERCGFAQPGEASVDPIVDRIGVEIELRRAASETVPDPGSASLDRSLVHIVEDDLVAVFEGELGDPAPIVPAPTIPTTPTMGARRPRSPCSRSFGLRTRRD